MARLVFDIEANGLLDTCTKMWVISIMNLDTKEKKTWLEGETGWIEYFDANATQVIGHNIVGYDLPAIEKMFNYVLPKSVAIIDTLVFSQTLNYRRFGMDGHGAERWGVYLGFPKINFRGEMIALGVIPENAPPGAEFLQFHPKMVPYCENDVELTIGIYNVVWAEYKRIFAENSLIKQHLKAEHAVGKWCAKAELNGWPFDVAEGKALLEKLESEMYHVQGLLEGLLGSKAVAVDKCKGVVETKRPKWIKNGFYDSHTSRWFNIDPCSGFEGEERPIAGEYCRVTFEKLKLSSGDDVKIFLFRHGWVPTEYNTVKGEDGRPRRTSPKITEDSLEFLGGDGKFYVDYLTAKSRAGILKTWLEKVDENGMLHGECIPIGTPSFRARHSVIVNVPAVDSKWGTEMRKLFKSKPGWKLIGCDSAGNQARGLAYYLNNQDFINMLLHGDIHQYNADVLTSVLAEMGLDTVVKRSQAKRILYAFLFGASGGKLWSYIYGVIDAKKGNKLKAGFLKAVPGFKDLIETLERVYRSTSKKGYGYVEGLTGVRIYVDSLHKLLVYLLQYTEKITCSAAVMLTMERLEAEGIPYSPCIMMHDEEQFMTPDEYAERASEIGRQAFVDGPKLFGINIMDGESKIGNDWYETH
jgi:DNA polymerase-1